MTPSHRLLSALGYPFENLVGVPSHIMAHGHHRRISESDARASSKGSEIKKEHELKEHPGQKFYKQVVGYCIRKVSLKRTFDKEEIIVLEAAERAKVKTKEDSDNFIV